MYLELAESLLRKGQPQPAAIYFQKIIQSCPETQQAEVAQDRLRQIRQQFAARAELEKPTMSG
jgi:hypothetical protein